MYEMRRQVCLFFVQVRPEGAGPDEGAARGSEEKHVVAEGENREGESERSALGMEENEKRERTYLSDATVSDADSFDGLHPSRGSQERE